jgi:hypothetical protein
MRGDCEECNRLWAAYLEARSEYARLKADFDSACGAGDGVTVQLLARKAQAAAEENELSRDRLALHEKAAHA